MRHWLPQLGFTLTALSLLGACASLPGLSLNANQAANGEKGSAKQGAKRTAQPNTSNGGGGIGQGEGVFPGGAGLVSGAGSSVALGSAGIVASGGGNAVGVTPAGVVAAGGGNAVNTAPTERLAAPAEGLNQAALADADPLASPVGTIPTGTGVSILPPAANGGTALSPPPAVLPPPVVLPPPASSLLANDGLGLIANDGGGLIPAPAGLVVNAQGNGLIANDGGSYLGGRALAVAAGPAAYRLAAAIAPANWQEGLANARVQIFLEDGSKWGKPVEANAQGYFAFDQAPPDGALAIARGQRHGKAFTVRGPITRGTGYWVICPGSSVALAMLKAEGQTAGQSMDASSFRLWANAICAAASMANVDDQLDSAEGMKTWYRAQLLKFAQLGELAKQVIALRQKVDQAPKPAKI